MSVPRMPLEIDTDRLVLRQARVNDAAVYREMWTERDPRVPPHRRIGPDCRPTVEDIAERIRADLDSQSSEFLTIVRKQEGDIIGYCGFLHGRRSSPREADLAYELLRRAHGAGYATEAARAVTDWAGEVGYRRLWAGVRAWNLASRNVLRKLSFVETGQVVPDTKHGDLLITARAFREPPR